MADPALFIGIHGRSIRGILADDVEKPVQNLLVDAQNCGKWRGLAFHSESYPQAVGLWIVPKTGCRSLPFGGGSGTQTAKNMQRMHPGAAGIRRERVEYIKEWVFLHKGVDQNPIRPQFFQRRKCRRIKGLRGFSTVSTRPTPTAGNNIFYYWVCCFGRVCIQQRRTLLRLNDGP